MRIINITPMEDQYLADGATTILLPVGPMPLGKKLWIIDNTGAFKAANCTVTGPINGATSLTLTTNWIAQQLVWVGAQFVATGEPYFGH